MKRVAAALCPALALLAASLASCAGVRRVLSVESDPPGAFVRLDERIIGRTPLEHEFDHYGTVRLTLYRQGSRTESMKVELSPPWYGRFPMDLLTDFLWPFSWTDRHRVRLALRDGQGATPAPDLDSVILRAHLARQARVFPAPGGEEPADDPGPGDGP